MNHTPEHGRGGTSGRILFSISFLMIFSAFYWNCFNVAEIRAFHKFDPHSECLVVGRLVQSRQEGILSYGGLPGFGYIEHLFPSGDRLFDFQCDSYLEDREFRGYWSYCSQIGGQAILLSLLDAAIPVSPRFKLALFRGITAALSAIMLALIVRWFLLEFGLAASLAVLFSIVMSQWLTYFGRNLWWSLWVFYLPLLGVIYFLRYQSTSIRRRPLLLAAVVGAAVFVKCVVNGYEYITTTLIMMVTPLVYYHLRDGLSARRLVVDGAVVVIASLLAVAISFLVRYWQSTRPAGRKYSCSILTARSSTCIKDLGSTADSSSIATSFSSATGCWPLSSLWLRSARAAEACIPAPRGLGAST